MSNDSDKFRRRSELEESGYTYQKGQFIKDDEKYLPLYEGKSFYIMDARYNRIEEDGNGYPVTEEEKSDPDFFPKCRYYVSERDFREQMERKDIATINNFFLAYRNIARPNDARTLIITPVKYTSLGHSANVLITKNPVVILGLLQSHIIDYIVRTKMQGINFSNFIFNQLPILPPEKLKQTPGIEGDATIEQSIRQILINLTNYSYDLEPFVKALGGQITPRPWDERERFDNFAKLDAIIAHLYNLTKNELKHIFADFKGEAKNQKAIYGEYLSQKWAFEYYEQIESVKSKESRDLSP